MHCTALNCIAHYLEKLPDLLAAGQPHPLGSEPGQGLYGGVPLQLEVEDPGDSDSAHERIRWPTQIC